MCTSAYDHISAFIFLIALFSFRIDSEKCYALIIKLF